LKYFNRSRLISEHVKSFRYWNKIFSRSVSKSDCVAYI